MAHAFQCGAVGLARRVNDLSRTWPREGLANDRSSVRIGGMISRRLWMVGQIAGTKVFAMKIFPSKIACLLLLCTAMPLSSAAELPKPVPAIQPGKLGRHVNSF